MKTNVEIKIECKGEAVGTLGWFNSIMNKSEFIIKNSNTGNPAIFLKTNEDEGKVTYRFLCKKWDKKTDPFGYRLTSDEYLCEVAESRLDGGGLFNIPLTPACKQAVEEVIQTAKEVFKEWWESQ